MRLPKAAARAAVLKNCIRKVPAQTCVGAPRRTAFGDETQLQLVFLFLLCVCGFRTAAHFKGALLY